jgi:hypothetical protein
MMNNYGSASKIIQRICPVKIARWHRPYFSQNSCPLLILVLFPLFQLFWVSVYSQQTFNDSIANNRNRITQTAMITLGSWAAANIVTGFIAAGQTQGESKYFWKMNAYWNLVNEGIAVMGYLSVRKAMRKKYGFSENESAQLSIEKLYAFNFGLDLAYIATGFFLREKGMNTTNVKSSDQLKGYGRSIVVQGGFLLLMDGIVLSLHHRNTVRLNNKLKSLELNAGSDGFGVRYSF